MQDGRMDTPRDKDALEVVVAAMPASVDMSPDLALVKPALLYGDRVRIISPLATLLAGVAALGYAQGIERAEVIEQIFEALGEPNAAEVKQVVTGIATLSQLPRAERRKLMGGKGSKELKNLSQQLDDLWSEVRGKVDEVLVQAHLDELVPAVEAGLVEVEPLVEEGKAFDLDRMMSLFVERVGRVLEKSLAYPLFDDKMGSLVDAGIAEGMFKLAPGTEERERQVGTAAELLSHLPAFPPASISDILGIRDDLKRPLTRFRAAMARVARDVSSGPRGAEFTSEIERIYRAEVAPALLEIREAIESSSYLNQLLGESARDIPAWLGAGFIALATTPITHLPEVAAIGMAAAGPAAKSAWVVAEKRRAIRQSQYYFLYETQALLT
jgi:hypothetical protein